MMVCCSTDPMKHYEAVTGYKPACVNAACQIGCLLSPLVYFLFSNSLKLTSQSESSLLTECSAFSRADWPSLSFHAHTVNPNGLEHCS